LASIGKARRSADVHPGFLFVLPHFGRKHVFDLLIWAFFTRILDALSMAGWSWPAVSPFIDGIRRKFDHLAAATTPSFAVHPHALQVYASRLQHPRLSASVVLGSSSITPAVDDQGRLTATAMTVWSPIELTRQFDGRCSVSSMPAQPNAVAPEEQGEAQQQQQPAPPPPQQQPSSFLPLFDTPTPPEGQEWTDTTAIDWPMLGDLSSLDWSSLLVE
jgi:hypothetical protein